MGFDLLLTLRCKGKECFTALRQNSLTRPLSTHILSQNNSLAILLPCEWHVILTVKEKVK